MLTPFIMMKEKSAEFAVMERQVIMIPTRQPRKGHLKTKVHRFFCIFSSCALLFCCAASCVASFWTSAVSSDAMPEPTPLQGPPMHVGGFCVQSGICKFDFAPGPHNKEAAEIAKNMFRYGQTVSITFNKEFRSIPVVNYSVTSYTMLEPEEEDHHHGKGPHFDYDLQLLEVTTEFATFKLASAAAAKEIRAIVTVWAMGTLKEPNHTDS